MCGSGGGGGRGLPNLRNGPEPGKLHIQVSRLSVLWELSLLHSDHSFFLSPGPSALLSSFPTRDEYSRLSPHILSHKILSSIEKDERHVSAKFPIHLSRP